MLRPQFFLFFILIILTYCASAQTVKRQNETINEKPVFPQSISLILKTNPLPILWGPIPLTSEFRLISELTVAHNQTNSIAISFLGKSPFVYIMEDITNQQGQTKLLIRGMRFQMTHKIFINGILNDLGLRMPEYAPEGIYFAPHFSYSTAKFTNRYMNLHDIYIRATYVNINLLGGYQVKVIDKLILDMFTGMGYKKNNWIEYAPPNITTIDFDDIPFVYSPFKFYLGFNIGYAF
jgi:hypothetical protein